MELKPLKVVRPSFTDYAKKQCDRIKEVFDVKSEASSDVDQTKLNTALAQFGGIFAYVIFEQANASMEHDLAANEFEIWHAKVFNEQMLLAKEQKSPQTNDAIKGMIIAKYEEEYSKRRRSIVDLGNRVSLYKSMKGVLEREASVLQTLSANLREELKMSSMQSSGVEASPFDGKRARR